MSDADAVRLRLRAQTPTAVCAVFGPEAEDVVTVLHTESRTPTYIVPKVGLDSVEDAVQVARDASNPAVVFLVDYPTTREEVQALYDAGVIYPGSGYIVQLGQPGSAHMVHQHIQRLGMWSCFRVFLPDARGPLSHAVQLAQLLGIRD